MNGAESLIRTLLAGGVDACFTNPGTSEIHIVAALDKIPEMRCVLGLFEGVVTGASDGYARMAEKPASTLLHLGPGLGNGLANLHNASRARVPIVNLVGQHATYHLQYDTPLTSDVEGIARPYSKWLRTSRSSSELGRDAAEAMVAARTAPGQIATLIVPADVSWSEGGSIPDVPAFPKSPLPDAQTVECAAAMLRSGLQTAILLDGNALYGRGLVTAGRIAAATGAKLLAPYPITRLQRGAGIPSVDRVQYVLEQGIEQFKEFRQLILVGTKAPVAYFAYPGKNSAFTSPDCQIHTLASPGEDYVGGLDALANALSIKGTNLQVEEAERPPIPSGEITLPGLGAVVGALLPENTIVVDESMTSGRGLMAATKRASPHEWLGNTGGSIGIALPLAVGAAVACPDRPVLCLTADGSGMYTAQALWTMAREGLNITTVVFANRDYAVLKREFSYLGVGNPGPRAAGMFEIGRPDLDWTLLAKGMGVPGTRVNSLDAFGKALRAGLEGEGPTLIEVLL
ncbi:MAG TPA: acetolactate synthase large subunit [Terriglobales bacterium]|jgi:acetolactate synthase-1/2/3 large subunit|nr:acetolactate synthase large subunit [Terriglobales bacterium]